MFRLMTDRIRLDSYVNLMTCFKSAVTELNGIKRHINVQSYSTLVFFYCNEIQFLMGCTLLKKTKTCIYVYNAPLEVQGPE